MAMGQRLAAERPLLDGMAEGMAEVERLADILLQRVAPDVAELDVDARLDHLGQLVPVGLREVEADESGPSAPGCRGDRASAFRHSRCEGRPCRAS